MNLALCLLIIIAVANNIALAMLHLKKPTKTVDESHIEDLKSFIHKDFLYISGKLDKLTRDILITQAEISDIKSMVDELSRHNSDIADVVDRAAKQYQDEISSLFSYCGENRSNE